MRFLTWLITLPLAAAVIIFALANRQAVTLSLWPFDLTAILPLSLLFLGTLLMGLLLGGLVAWLGSFKYRLQARRLRQENAQLAERLGQLEAPPAKADANLLATQTVDAIGRGYEV